MSENFNLSNLDFATYKESLKSYLRGQSEFSDYSFEGSNLSVLLNLLSYNTYLLSYYNNANMNEAYLDSAQLRNSVISKVKELGYTPRSTRGAIATVNITVSGAEISSSITTLTIPKFHKFVTSIDGVSYTFCAKNAYTVYRTTTSTDSYFYFENVELVEGSPIITKFIINQQNPDQRFVIPNKGVDTTSLVVTTTNGLSVDYYYLADETISITGTNKVFWLQEYRDELFELYFGDGNLGYKPEDNLSVIIQYIVSNGELGNGAYDFIPSDPITNATNSTIVIETIQNAIGGSTIESVKDIKFFAPKNFEAQNRCVTTSDYRTILLREYPNIDSISVWGGEDNIPPYYGKVFISIKPIDGFILSDTEKYYITDKILKNRSVVTLSPQMVDPEYIYPIINSTVKYDSKLTSKTPNQLKSDIITEIKKYNTDNLGDFDYYFRFSNFVAYIDNVNSAIKNNTTTIKLKKSILPLTNVSIVEDIKFSNELDYDYTLKNQFISSSYFTFHNVLTNQYVTNCMLINKELDLVVVKVIGNLQQIECEQITDGADILVVGSVDPLTGIISLTQNFEMSSFSGDTFDIIAVPKNYDIYTNTNQLIYIQDNDITVTMIEDSINQY